MQAAGNSPDPSISPPLEGFGNQTNCHARRTQAAWEERKQPGTDY